MVDNGNINNCPYQKCKSSDVAIEYDDHEKAFVICRTCGARGPRNLMASESRGQWNELHEDCYSKEKAIELREELVVILGDDDRWPEENF